MKEVEKLDSSIEKSKWGGYREGAGRKEGSKNKATLEQQLVKKAFIDRVNKSADKLFNAQLDLAIGEKYLMVVRTIGAGSKSRRETSVVTNADTIKQFLDDTLEEDDNEYYFMTTKPANGMAIDSLLNRSIGKPTEKMEIEHSGEINTGEVDPLLATEFAEFMKGKTKE